MTNTQTAAEAELDPSLFIESKNTALAHARKAGNDEFYTRYEDIETEMNAYAEYNPDVFRDKTLLLPCDDPEWSNFTKYFAANFERFGLRKLISTSYAKSSGNRTITRFESESGRFDQTKHETRGRVFVIDRDKPHTGRIDHTDIVWDYLQGDGDFRSEEVTALRDEADVIITNPPFSLFREFLAWIQPEKRKFCIIGNQNAITYKEVFPLLKNNTIWLGCSIHSGDRKFNVPDSYPLEAAGCGIDTDGRKFIRVKGVRWYTNLDHGLRHEPLNLMTMRDNLIYNRKLRNILSKPTGKYQEDPKHLYYPKYDNYDALEVPVTDAIPGDYDGVMGVPITFMDKYNPEQFEVLGITQRNDDPYKLFRYTKEDYKNANDLNARATIMVNGIPKSMYPRILIRPKKGGNA